MVLAGRNQNLLDATARETSKYGVTTTDTVLFDVALDSCSTSSPTGSPTCANLRVETPASIRSITALVSGSRSAKYS